MNRKFLMCDSAFIIINNPLNIFNYYKKQSNYLKRPLWVVFKVRIFLFHQVKKKINTNIIDLYDSNKTISSGITVFSSLLFHFHVIFYFNQLVLISINCSISLKA